MRLLVVKLSSLGDILHVLPTVHELRTQLDAEVDWVVHPEFAPLVRCFADVDNVLSFPRHHVLRDIRAALRELRAREYDLVVDLHGLFKSGLVARLARAKRRIAPSYAREGSSLFFRERAGSGAVRFFGKRRVKGNFFVKRPVERRLFLIVNAESVVLSFVRETVPGCILGESGSERRRFFELFRFVKFKLIREVFPGSPSGTATEQTAPSL